MTVFGALDVSDAIRACIIDAHTACAVCGRLSTRAAVRFDSVRRVEGGWLCPGDSAALCDACDAPDGFLAEAKQALWW